MSTKADRATCRAMCLGLALLAASCGKQDAKATSAPDKAVAPATPAATAKATALPTAKQDEACRFDEACESRCGRECRAESRERGAFVARSRAEVSAAKAPFRIVVERAWLEGACGQGDDPAKRREPEGVSARVEGKMTYTGKDIIGFAMPVGELFLRFGESRYVEAEAPASDAYYYGSKGPVSRFIRDVRGADPWFPGETRSFHFETRPVSPVFCEVMPDEAGAYVAVETMGVHGGRETHAVAFVPLHWEEVTGMAVGQQVKVAVKTKDAVSEEPADSHFSRLGRMLVTRLSGKTEWLPRGTLVQNGDLAPGKAAAMPAEASSADWRIKVAALTHAKEFGGFAPKGEDQFLLVVDVALTYSPAAGAAAKPASLKGAGFKLETAPGRWVSRETKAMGQLDASAEIPPGGTASGKVVFPRQRFERPFRLEVTTPDKGVSLVDVFSYDIGPERGRI
jgi:hypothetical protein